MDNVTVKIKKCPQNKNITLFAVKGFIVTTTVLKFEKYFYSALNHKNFKLVIDLKGVDYISGAGWSVFINQIKRIRDQKGDLLLAGMSPEVSEIFELLEFNNFLKSFPNVESAVEKGFGETPAACFLGEPAGTR